MDGIPMRGEKGLRAKTSFRPPGVVVISGKSQKASEESHNTLGIAG